MAYTKVFERPYSGGWVDYPSETTLITADALNEYDETFQHVEDYLEDNPISQTSTIPTASEDEEGNIYQYVGETTATYTQGYFYKCVSDGAVEPTYSWQRINVQPSGGGGSSALTDLTDVNITTPTNGQILKYDATNAEWINGAESSGTSDYSDLTNKPSINNVTLSGNKTSSDFGLANASDIPTELSELASDSTHRLVTDTEKSTWNDKQNALPTVVNDRYLHTNASTGALEWSAVQGGGGSSTLAGLSDVSIATPTNGQVLVYDGTNNEWVNNNVGGLSLPIDISDNVNNVTGVLNIANGGTGNADGYIRTGQLSGSTMGTRATAEGQNTTASGNRSHAEGSDTIASGSQSHAEGLQTTASATADHAEGNYTTASGSSSHAEGLGTTASSARAHAEGYHTTASGMESHAEGNYTTADGEYSHAEGFHTRAAGTASHAEGSYANAFGVDQHVEGRYNIADNNNYYAHIVGNGTADDARSNAHTLTWSGNAWFAGTITDGTGNVLSDKQNKLPTVVNDRYLHTNASTGALEWAQVQGGGGSSATILTGTLTAGQTTITFTDSAITSTALIDIYTDNASIGWTSRSVSGTTLTVVFPVQTADLSVKIRIESGV